MSDLINRQDAIDAIEEIRSCIWEVDIPSPTVPEYIEHHKQMQKLMDRCDTLRNNLVNLQSAEPEQEDYTEMKREFLRMASYIDVILECSDEQKETLLNFISRLAEFMPWTERD